MINIYLKIVNFPFFRVELNLTDYLGHLIHLEKGSYVI